MALVTPSVGAVRLTFGYEMKEQGIIFSGPLILPIQEEIKTQTRRLRNLDKINANPDHWKFGGINRDGQYIFYSTCDDPETCELKCDGTLLVKCPYGVVGGGLWVRETWQAISPDENWRSYEECKIIYKATDEHPGFYAPEYAEVYGLKHSSPVWDMDQVFPWKPSIHMPRWASRINLKIINIRIERLHNISEEDAKAEGVPKIKEFVGFTLAFMELWDSINDEPRKGGINVSWKANPWVWALTFKISK